MSEFLNKALEKELRKIKLLLGHNPILVISSDDERLKQFFIKEVSKFTNAISEYELYYPVKKALCDQWQQGNILLLDFEDKLKNYIKRESNPNYYGQEDWHHVYHALIDYRDWFRKYGEQTMIIVCNNKTRIDMCMDAQLRCCIDFILIDNWLAKPEIFYKDILKQTESCVK